jgi:hypothetical protein
MIKGGLLREQVNGYLFAPYEESSVNERGPCN